MLYHSDRSYSRSRSPSLSRLPVAPSTSLVQSAVIWTLQICLHEVFSFPIYSMSKYLKYCLAHEIYRQISHLWITKIVLNWLDWSSQRPVTTSASKIVSFVHLWPSIVFMNISHLSISFNCSICHQRWQYKTLLVFASGRSFALQSTTSWFFRSPSVIEDMKRHTANITSRKPLDISGLFVLHTYSQISVHEEYLWSIVALYSCSVDMPFTLYIFYANIEVSSDRLGTIITQLPSSSLTSGTAELKFRLRKNLTRTFPVIYCKWPSKCF